MLHFTLPLINLTVIFQWTTAFHTSSNPTWNEHVTFLHTLILRFWITFLIRFSTYPHEKKSFLSALENLEAEYDGTGSSRRNHICCLTFRGTFTKNFGKLLSRIDEHVKGAMICFLKYFEWRCSHDPKILVDFEN